MSRRLQSTSSLCQKQRGPGDNERQTAAPLVVGSVPWKLITVFDDAAPPAFDRGGELALANADHYSQPSAFAIRARLFVRGICQLTKGHADTHVRKVEAAAPSAYRSRHGPPDHHKIPFWRQSHAIAAHCLSYTDSPWECLGRTLLWCCSAATAVLS